MGEAGERPLANAFWQTCRKLLRHFFCPAILLALGFFWPWGRSRVVPCCRFQITCRRGPANNATWMWYLLFHPHQLRYGNDWLSRNTPGSWIAVFGDNGVPQSNGLEQGIAGGGHEDRSLHHHQLGVRINKQPLPVDAGKGKHQAVARMDPHLVAITPETKEFTAGQVTGLGLEACRIDQPLLRHDLLTIPYAVLRQHQAQ